MEGVEGKETILYEKTNFFNLKREKRKETLDFQQYNIQSICQRQQRQEVLSAQDSKGVL